jgi:tetratricopeptide (TPR) repeat protein
MTATGLGVAAVIAAGLIYAEATARQDSPAALNRALSIESKLAGAPNADHLERLAEIDSSQPEPALREAVRVDPRRSAAWMTLGLRAEQHGEWIEAEHDLLEAARLDHQYLPAWTLTNFHFRRGNPDAFWKWARRAALLTYDEYSPLFRMVDHFDQDPLGVLQKLGNGVKLERAYLSYAIGRNRLDAAQLVAVRLASLHDASDASRLADLATRQIAAGHPGEALEAWNAFHTPPLDPARGPILTNPDFRSPPTREGFDWTLSAASLCPGMAATWSPGQTQFNFSGGQPDDCILLTQALILAPRHRYRLKFEYRMEGRPAPSGIDWDLAPLDGTGALRLAPSGAAPDPLQPRPPQPRPSQQRPSQQRPPPPPASQNWTPSERLFPDVHGTLVRLRLMYHRQPGTVRYEGSVCLRDLRLEVL